jgi:penicillin amidase
MKARGALLLPGIALALLARATPGVPATAAATPAATLHLAGLHSSVEVLRDRWGVAHIYASNEHDLFFAQGAVAASDRLLQMELWKRAGQGRLAEILGPAALARDVSARALQYHGDLKAEYASYAPRAEAILGAFTDGINAYIAALTAPGGKGLPREFALAGFAPEPWRPQDCLNRMAAYSMTGNAVSELTTARAIAELGAARAAKYFGFDPPVALSVPAGLDLTGLTPELLKSLIGSDQRIGFNADAHEGSNNWTISGGLTASGRPLLANDPHRVLALPSLRYLVHLVAPGWNVIGAGEPGLPGVALGHNEQIAWGFTIFGLDQQDLYVEELNPHNPLEYKTESGWAAMSTRREVFRIKGAGTQSLDLKLTRHGPVLWQDGRRALALRWVGSEPGTAGYLASLALDQAHGWDDFEAAIPRWKVPSENLVYADRAGNIGEHSAGLAPIRSWNGLLPVPGASGSEWHGFVPAAQLPHVFNPPAGFVATANHKMIPADYPFPVGFEWEAPYRYTRIREFIEAAHAARRALSLEDMAALQNDVVSLPARALQRLVRAGAQHGDAAFTEFLRWDGVLTRDSAAAAIYEVAWREICSALARRLAGAHSAHYQGIAPHTAQRLLADADPELFGGQGAVARDALLLEAFRAAHRQLAVRLGSDSATWSWGALHTMRFRHPLDQLPGAADFDRGPLPRPGDGYTVNATWFDDSWQQTDGASYRQILDSADWDRSLAVNTPGQGGTPGTRHYDDLLPLWDTGRYFPLSYSRAAVERVTTERLTLAP